MVCKRLCPAPCQKSCPAGVDVPTYNAFTAMGQFDKALEVIREDNPFPGVCGRICSRACEASCRLGQTDDPTAIRSLKRFVADYDRGRWKPLVQPAPTTRQEKVSIIGAGPAGLTAARDLRREGYSVTVFEAASQPGGMLRLAVPDFRLPPEVVDSDIQFIIDSGVVIQTNVTVGKDISIDELRKQGYQAILIAIGAHRSIPLGIPGGNGPESCPSAVDFLKEVKLGKCRRVTGSVLVVGSSYSALDAARTAVRLGGSEVGLVFQRGRDQLPFEEAELKAAEEEGVVIHCLRHPLELLRSNGKVSGIKCRVCEPQAADQTGRARVTQVAGAEEAIPAQTVIFAGAQEPDLSLLSKDLDLRRNEWNLIAVDPASLSTNQPGVFAAGDVTTGGATVIEAIAAGQKAAAAIHRYLRGMDQSVPFRWVRPRRRVEFGEMGEGPENFKRPQEAMRPASERAHDFRQADLTYSEMLAFCGARRCLRCDMD